MASEYKKKPVVVEAVQWTGNNHAEMCEFIDPEVFEIIPRVGLVIHTLEGDHHASPGDYIIKGVNGEFYPCKPDIFAKTYESPTLTPPNEPRAGLYGKYTVYKNKDGSLVTDCFILRPAKDPAAVAALRAYAATTDNAELAADIINWVGAEPNEWVRAEERLPEHLKDVLALYGNGRIDIDWVDSSGNFKFGSLFDGVTHWMPLPAPPDRRPTEGEV